MRDFRPTFVSMAPSHSGRTRSNTVYFFAGTLGGNLGTDPAVLFDRSVEQALHWLMVRFKHDIPKEAVRLESFEAEFPGTSLDAVSIPGRSWSARLVQPDMPFRGNDAVAGRVWTTDVGIERDLEDGPVIFGMRVTCSSQAFAVAPISLSRPTLVLQLANSIGLSDGRLIGGRVWEVATEDDLNRFQGLVFDPNRSLPVVVLTEADGKRLGGPVSKFLLDAESLAAASVGLYHLAALTADQAWKWTGRVGKEWSVFQGAVRTYQPGADLENDDPRADHPLATPVSILSFQSGGSVAERAFEQFLVDNARKSAAARQPDRLRPTFYLAAKQVEAEEKRRASVGSAAELDLFVREVDALTAQVKSLTEEAQAYNDDAIECDRRLRIISDENRRLRAQVDSLRARLEEKEGELVDQRLELPATYEDFAEWVDQNLVGRLVLHPRAIRGLKDASYEEPELVAKALLCLANEYRNMRLGYEGAKDRFDETALALELRLSGSIAENRAGEQGETYYIRFPLHSESRRFMDSHLRKGNSFEPRYCLAIYFLWDEDSSQVVVGWLPSHLDNRLS